MSDIIIVSDKIGIKVHEYNGKYSLQACYGNYVKWAKYRVGKDTYGDKDRPVEVELGDKATAVKTLTKILDIIEPVGAGLSTRPDDYVPF
jgi:hypothetical protein